MAYAGYHGERSLLYHLNFVEQDYHFFHDLRLPWKNGYHFQIDILLLSPA
ncbi:nuclease-related domain-containing protein [Oceanobacillus massiliensis]